MKAARKQRDWVFSERDKIVRERDSIRMLCDKLRRERDNVFSQFMSAVKDSDDMKQSKLEAQRQLNELQSVAACRWRQYTLIMTSCSRYHCSKSSFRFRYAIMERPLTCALPLYWKCSSTSPYVHVAVGVVSTSS